MLAGAATFAFGAGGLAGCDYREICYDDFTCIDQGAVVVEDPCAGDPATAPAVDGCGVFVSAQGSDANPGTRSAPFRTLQHAIDEAGRTRLNRIYACEDSFDEKVALMSGIDLWGGRRCEGDAYSPAGPDHLTTIAPQAVGIPLRVIGGERQAETLPLSMVFGVKVVAANASASDGMSSIAMILSDQARVHVRSSEIVAGDGKDGEPGGDAPIERAKDGVLGNNGAPACSAHVVEGAPQVVTECEYGLVSIGGKGGDGRIDQGEDGADGRPHPAGSSQGGRGAENTVCSVGEAGLAGQDAEHALGATGIGSLSIYGWVGVPGPDGAMGGIGHGGGGGGGGRARLSGQDACRAGPRGGGAGGSGGSGGCGGRGGKGGGYGGASIAIVALEGTELTVEATLVATGHGGHGGVGGTGQEGGRSSFFGLGGQGAFGGTALTAGCIGGVGGQGGRGGDAGGGLGGHSIGVASVGTNVRFLPGDNFRTGNAGYGGVGANPIVNEGRAANGVDGIWEVFPANDVPPR